VQRIERVVIEPVQLTPEPKFGEPPVVSPVQHARDMEDKDHTI
jgi:hypothetical protein